MALLKARVLTAILLLAGLLPSVFWLSQAMWAALMGVVAGIACWEWGALAGMRNPVRLVFGGLAGALLCLVSLTTPALVDVQQPILAFYIYGLTIVFWLAIVPMWLFKGWKLSSGMIGLVTGVVVIFPAWLAIVQLRALGTEILLGVLAVVWIADVAAYFAGKRFGKRKLAPSISPGKTWEGVFGAMAGVVLYGFAIRDGFQLVVSADRWLLALLIVTGVSIVGDLFESMLKRQVGLKDSSQILPGHGGVLDRIDSLTSTLPCVAFMWLLIDRI